MRATRRGSREARDYSAPGASSFNFPKTSGSVTAAAVVVLYAALFTDVTRAQTSPSPAPAPGGIIPISGDTGGGGGADAGVVLIVLCSIFGGAALIALCYVFYQKRHRHIDTILFFRAQFRGQRQRDLWWVLYRGHHAPRVEHDKIMRTEYPEACNLYYELLNDECTSTAIPEEARQEFIEACRRSNKTHHHEEDKIPEEFTLQNGVVRDTAPEALYFRRAMDFRKRYGGEHGHYHLYDIFRPHHRHHHHDDKGGAQGKSADLEAGKDSHHGHQRIKRKELTIEPGSRLSWELCLEPRSTPAVFISMHSPATHKFVLKGAFGNAAGAKRKESVAERARRSSKSSRELLGLMGHGAVVKRRPSGAGAAGANTSVEMAPAQRRLSGTSTATVPPPPGLLPSTLASPTPPPPGLAAELPPPVAPPPAAEAMPPPPPGLAPPPSGEPIPALDATVEAPAPPAPVGDEDGAPVNEEDSLVGGEGSTAPESESAGENNGEYAGEGEGGSDAEQQEQGEDEDSDDSDGALGAFDHDGQEWKFYYSEEHEAYFFTAEDGTTQWDDPREDE